MHAPINDRQIQARFGDYCMALSTGNPSIIQRAFNRLSRVNAQRDGVKLSGNAPGNVVRGQRTEQALREVEGQ
jgi:hypothetical protein